MIQKMWEKYKGLFFYGLFGVLTTVINIYTYILFYEKIGLANVPSTVIAWVLAVAFAYITNKIWVFDSKSWKKEIVMPELVKFFSCRLATGILDILIMWIGVDLLAGPSRILKLASNILVIIINYVFSKLVIFVKKKED